MGVSTMHPYHLSLLLALLLCSCFLRPSQGQQLHGGAYEPEKVPSSFIVPDPTPVFLPPLAAPPPVTTGGDDDMRPRLPTERRWRQRGRAHAHALAPSPLVAGPARAPAPASWADAPSPDSESSGAPVIESSPAVPVPRGVRDTATILPMPAPGVKRQDVGRATSVRPGMVPAMVVLVFIAMASL